MKQQSSPHILIRIHGTFAASDEDSGEKWWQNGSEFERALSTHLPTGAFEFEPRAFHWSGKNKENHRRVAAEHLLYNYLLPYEASQTSYHLIAHSHGGNVVRLAVRLAAESNIRLDHLQSWTTVGTPFLNYRKRILWSLVWRLLTFVTGLLFVTLLFMAGMFLLAAISPVGSPLKFDRMELGLMVFLSLIFFVPILGAATILNVARLWQQRKFRKSQEEQWPIEERWLGIWSQRDEAIMSIRFAEQHSSELLPKLFKGTRDEALQDSDRRDLKAAQKQFRNLGARRVVEGKTDLSQTDKYYRWARGLGHVLIVMARSALLSGPAWLVKKLMLPVANTVFTGLIKRVASGDDLEFEKFVEVTPYPIPALHEFRGLPENLEAALLDQAVRQLASAQGNVRRALTLDLVDDPDAIEGASSLANGLIHCSYFDVDEIVVLIAEGVKLHANGIASERPEESHTKWLEEQRSVIREQVSTPS